MAERNGISCAKNLFGSMAERVEGVHLAGMYEYWHLLHQRFPDSLEDSCQVSLLS